MSRSRSRAPVAAVVDPDHLEAGAFGPTQSVREKRWKERSVDDQLRCLGRGATLGRANSDRHLFLGRYRLVKKDQHDIHASTNVRVRFATDKSAAEPKDVALKLFSTACFPCAIATCYAVCLVWAR